MAFANATSEATKRSRGGRPLRYGRLFLEDPSNHFELGARHSLSAEQRLWWAVLTLALQEATDEPPPLRKGALFAERQRHNAYHDAIGWVFSEENHVASFSWVCDMLRLEPDAIRRKLVVLDPHVVWKSRRPVYAGGRQHRVEKHRCRQSSARAVRDETRG